MDLDGLTAVSAVKAFAARTLSPVELLEACFARFDAAEPVLNAFCWTDRERALAAARASEARWTRGDACGALDGVPFAAKDLSPLAGAPFRRGSHRTSREPETVSTPALTHVAQAGALVVGKTTTPEFGWKGVTDSPLTGITRNPWDPACTPGGSSGGAAAAVASGMALLAEGTDGAGSIRMPCAFTGLFGLYPTAGRIPYVPVSTLGTITQAGPMTKTVADGAALFGAMMGDDPRDPVRLPDPRRDWTTAPEGGAAGLRLAYAPALNGAAAEPDVTRAVDAALAALQDLGAAVEEVADPFPRPVRPLFETIYATAMARIRRAYPTAGTPVDSGFEAMADAGERVDAVTLAEALMERDVAAVALNRFFTTYDALITPQMPTTAFAAGHDVPPASGMAHWFDWSPYTYPFNFSNTPAGTMPCGFGEDGLPVALQIVAPRYCEALIFRIAAAYEAVRPIPVPGQRRLTQNAATS